MYELGYFGLFVASFISATILPFCSEAILSGMILGGFDPVLTVVVATLGNWLGSMSTYALGYIGNIERIEKWLRISKEKTDKYRSVTEKYGAWFGLLVWIPVIGDVLAVCMGLVRTPVVKSTILILIGKTLRYSIWCYLTLYASSCISTN